MSDNMCVLVQENGIMVVQGKPTVYLKNEDFDNILRNPQIAIKLAKVIQSGKLSKGLLVGRLGKSQNGEYRENYSTVSVTIPGDKRELNYYERL